jgi:4-amino-4-deoxy-L-arabinose transferase-like glycosyltransferase
MWLRDIAALVLTYAVASDACCLLVLRLTRGRGSDWAHELLVLTRGAGPIVISWILYQLFILIPGRAPALYVGAVVAVLAAMTIAGRREMPALAESYRWALRAVGAGWSRGGLARVLLTCIAAIALFVIVIGVAFPIVEGDALGFAIEARLIHRDLGFAHYPTTVPDPATGYYYDTFQAPSLQLMYVWFYLLTGTSAVDVLPRTVGPVYAILSLLLVAWLVVREGGDVEAGLWAALALLATYVFTSAAYLNTQDPHRFFFSLCPLVLLADLLRERSRALLVLVGVALGLGFYAHFFGFVTLGAVMLIFLWRARGSFSSRVADAARITAVALIAGVGWHYARPIVLQRVGRQFPAIVAPLYEYIPRGARGDLATAIDPARLHGSQAWILERRGQFTRFGEIVFGRLQMLTGFEWFGFVFWAGLAGIAWWARRRRKTELEIVLVATAAVYTLAVVSDVRTLSSSNPRYIATAVPLVAYFVGILAHHVTTRRSPVLRFAFATLLIGVLAGPFVATAAIRGAKVGITNPGDLYARLRNGTWVSVVVRHPFRSAAAVWRSYLGIRDTLRYAAATDGEKLRHAHDVFAAVAYMHDETPPRSTALVFRVTPYFYYAGRRGVSYLDPRMVGPGTTDPIEACRFLVSIGVDHVLMDGYYTSHPMVNGTALGAVLATPALSTRVFEYGTADVYRLHCDGAGGPPGSDGHPSVPTS